MESQYDALAEAEEMKIKEWEENPKVQMETFRTQKSRGLMFLRKNVEEENAEEAAAEVMSADKLPEHRSKLQSTLQQPRMFRRCGPERR